MILQYMLKVMFVDNFDGGVNFCGTFFSRELFFADHEKSAKIRTRKNFN